MLRGKEGKKRIAHRIAGRLGYSYRTFDHCFDNTRIGLNAPLSGNYIFTKTYKERRQNSLTV